jgi:hypothetical protein
MRSDVTRPVEPGLVRGPPFKGSFADLQSQAHTHKLLIFFVKLMGWTTRVLPQCLKIFFDMCLSLQTTRRLCVPRFRPLM